MSPKGCLHGCLHGVLMGVGPSLLDSSHTTTSTCPFPAARSNGVYDIHPITSLTSLTICALNRPRCWPSGGFLSAMMITFRFICSNAILESRIKGLNWCNACWISMTRWRFQGRATRRFATLRVPLSTFAEYPSSWTFTLLTTFDFRNKLPKPFWNKLPHLVELF